jgi:rhamnosyltransferase
MTRSTRDVTILLRTLNAAPWLPELLDRLSAQTLRPRELLVVDSESTDDTVARVEAAGPVVADAGARVVTLPRRDFTHARSTNLGFREARGEVVAMLSQDALPADDDWLARLVAPLDGTTVAAFSRQVPRPGAYPLERWQIEADYPAAGAGVGGAAAPGVAYSNVASAALRSAWTDEPFDESLLISEDRVWARRQADRGRRVAYVPESAVLHSHRYSLREAAARCAEEARARRAAEGTREGIGLLLKGWPRQTLRDAGRLAGEGRLHAWPHAAVYRFAQLYGMWRGGR